MTDEQYLTLRAEINGARTDEAEQAYWSVMAALLTPKVGHHVLDAVEYYGMNPLDRRLREVSAHSLRGGVIVANELMVNADQSVPVPSHFERIVMEVVKIYLCSYAGMPFVRLSRERDTFKREVEDEWLHVLQYGNGYHGFSVYPRIRIEDLVRYQLLRGTDDLVSWSISNWVIWSMTAYPSIVQTLIPEFGENVFGTRLRSMYEPLVQSYATRLVKRRKLIEGKDCGGPHCQDKKVG